MVTYLPETPQVRWSEHLQRVKEVSRKLLGAWKMTRLIEDEALQSSGFNADQVSDRASR